MSTGGGLCRGPGRPDGSLRDPDGAGQLTCQEKLPAGPLVLLIQQDGSCVCKETEAGLRLWLQTGTSYHRHQGRGERLTQRGGYEGTTTGRNAAEREPSLRRPQPHPAQSQDGCEVRDSQPCTVDHLGSFF